MSLLCYEDDLPLKISDEAFCVTTAAAERFTAICAEHILKIPESERLRERTEHGLDIHFLFSRPNKLPMFTGNLSWGDVQFGDYRFSVRSEVARLILPHSCELYLD